MEILGKILGNPARVKLMRLFLLNPKSLFSKKYIVKRSRVSSNIARKEINLLFSVGFIKKQGTNWLYDNSFKYGRELERLLVSSDSLDKKVITGNFKKTGRVKLLLLSGIFIKSKDSTVDLLIVGDKMKKGKIEEEIKKLEAEIGAELTYSIFDTKDFLYRLDMYDKLVRDIIDFPHEVLIQGKELNLEKSLR